MGYKAIIIYGDPEYYQRFGFKESKAYHITNKEGKYPAALLVLELYPNALTGICGIFDEGKIYEIDENELEEFEKGFEIKEKGFWDSPKKDELTDDHIQQFENMIKPYEPAYTNFMKMTKSVRKAYTGSYFGGAKTKEGKQKRFTTIIERLCLNLNPMESMKKKLEEKQLNKKTGLT
jgi:hypothetical protein